MKRSRYSFIKESHRVSVDTTGTAQLHAWVYDEPSRFPPNTRTSLLSSTDIHGHDVLLFVLRFVFAWSALEMCSGHFMYFDDRWDDDRWEVAFTHVDRIKALNFVTLWLTRDPPGESSIIPSLSRLCAQRIAMEIFPTLTGKLDRYFNEEDLVYFTDGLKDDVVSMLNDREIPDSFHQTVMEELFIFSTVYFLYTDLRTMISEPSNGGSLKLPVSSVRDEEWDEDWWEYYGMDSVVNCVPDCGRGSLAKAGLLPHAVHVGYKKLLSLKDCHGDGYGYIDVIDKLFDKGDALCVKHPLSSEVAVGPIASLAFTYSMSNSFEESEYDQCVILDILLPWINELLDLRELDQSSYSFLHLAATKASREPSGPPKMDDLSPFSISMSREVIQEWFDAFDARTYLKDMEFENGFYVKRLRLNGKNYSKIEMLQAAILARDAEIVDLEHCWNLDEECFAAVMNLLRRVKVVLLKGTAIDENSDAVKNAIIGRKHFVKFLFSDACKCCGRTSESIKTLTVGGPNNK